MCLEGDPATLFEHPSARFVSNSVVGGVGKRCACLGGAAENDVKAPSQLPEVLWMAGSDRIADVSLGGVHLRVADPKQ